MGTFLVFQETETRLPKGKTMPRLLFALFFLAGLAQSRADDFQWPREGQIAAIVLTYDDTLQSHLDIAIPQLDAAKLKGTFFLGANMTPEAMVRWRTVAGNGHELGNHTLFHPCPRAILPDRKQFLTEDYDVGRMMMEVGAMNLILFGIDGQRVRTLSAPCSQTIVGGVDYTSELRRSGFVKFVRTGGDQYNSVVTNFRMLDPFAIPSYGPLDKPGGATLIAYVDRVRAAHGLGVFQFHGVGGDYLDVTAQAHQALIDHLKKHPDVWVATFREVMDYVSTHSR
ncbi:MAG TPA: polysaccharide deacetylase family protein [Steroidobacteraceae bacterium]